jgi:nucleoside-diphosphate-sugar epimerase
VEQLGGADVVVNAAGLAAPENDDEADLYGANTMAAAVLAEAAAAAGVARFVHISTAAVQGRRDPLDESPEVEPMTPYARSKSSAESILLERRVGTPASVSIYRPASVQGRDRAMTRQLVKLAGHRWVPVAGAGDAPVPVSLVDNVAAGIVHLVRSPEVPGIVLQPWEGMTSRSLLASLGGARIVGVSPALMGLAVHSLYAAGTRSARIAAVARRADLLVFGQRQDARALADLGFSPLGGAAAYARLAAEVRADLAGELAHRR